MIKNMMKKRIYLIKNKNYSVHIIKIITEVSPDRSEFGNIFLEIPSIQSYLIRILQILEKQLGPQSVKIISNGKSFVDSFRFHRMV